MLEKDIEEFMQRLASIIPFLNKFTKKRQISYFLVLILKNEKTSAVIFEEEEAKIKVIGQNEEYFRDSIEKSSEEEFIDVLDKTISKAEENLPENIEAQKTIFGVKEDWTENSKIKKEYLLMLKKASSALGLIPIGFLVIPEAISHFLQKEEGAPVSAIFVDCGKKFITVSLFRAGKLTETKTSEIHQSIVFTVDTLLKHLETPEILPSRIVLYDGEENLNQEFISHRWSKSLPFLHLPQITNLPLDFDAQAVLFGVASQMGFEVLEETYKKEDVRKETKDIKQEKDIRETEEKQQIPTEDIGAFSDFGFEKETDVAKKDMEIIPDPINKSVPTTTKDLEKPLLSKPTFSISIFKKTLQKALTVFKKIVNPLKSVPLTLIFKNSLGKKFFIVPLIIVIIFLSIFVFYTFGSKTTIVLNINPKIIEQTGNVTFITEKSETSSLENVILGQLISTSKEAENQTATTGKKEVGDKAKGTVTVFNNSGTTKTLPRETVITSSNGLNFVLIDNVTVASASGDVFSGTTPGKANVNVQAGNIGQEYNLPSSTKFSIGENPLIAAKNDNPFSGGTKKEITVVAKKDMDKLLLDLPKITEQKAKDDLLKNLSSDKKLLPVFTKVSLTQKDFDKNVDDQSNTLKLKGIVSYEGLSYKEADLIAFAKKLLENKTSKDLTIDYKNIKVEVKEISKKNYGEIIANLNIKGLLIPKIDDKKLAKETAGMSYQKAKEKLSKLSQIKSIEIQSFPKLPFFKMVSKSPKNITISLSINE